MSELHHGSCLCGAVRFAARGALGQVTACHCSLCRKHSGHFDASCEVKKADLRIEGEEALRWYAATPKARRGFCGTCGASLFFDPPHLDWVGVSMGAFDGPTGTRLALHIFCADKGDYYEITDGLPQNAR